MQEEATRRGRTGSLLRWLRSGDGILALVALVFGAFTVAAFSVTSPGWPRLDLATLVGPLWLAFAAGWVVFATGFSRSPVSDWRRWLITPTIVAIALVLTLAGVALSNQLRGTTARIDIHALAIGGAVQVRGTTDLPDGSRISVSAYHDAVPGIVSYTDAHVDGGTYEAALALERWPNGPLSVAAAFAMDGNQPAEAVERFGPDGERLSGPDVHFGSDGPVLSASVAVELRDGLASDDPQALKAPATVMGMIKDANGEVIESATAECIYPRGPAEQDWDFEWSSAGG
jgi:hypothetical protein